MTQEMLKFILAARRKREDTQARYFYEWGNIHVALMTVNPVVFTLFRRYVQHYSISGVASAQLPLPLSPMEWDNMADHWLQSYEDLLRALTDPEYVVRMQPHKFGDSAFNVMLMAGEVLHQVPQFASGGIKLLLWGASPAGATQAETASRWAQAVHAPLLETAAGKRIRKYVHNTPRQVDPAMFAGTLFARGGINAFAFLDELWFETLEDALSAQADRHAQEVFATGRAALDSEKSFAMITTERVVADFVTEGERTPLPAVLSPGSFEARLAAHGGEGWNLPPPARIQAPVQAAS